MMSLAKVLRGCRAATGARTAPLQRARGPRAVQAQGVGWKRLRSRSSMGGTRSVSRAGCENLNSAEMVGTWAR